MRVWKAVFTAIAEPAAATPIYQDPSYSFAERSADLSAA